MDVNVNIEKYLDKFSIETLMYVFYNIFIKKNQQIACEEL